MNLEEENKALKHRVNRLSIKLKEAKERVSNTQELYKMKILNNTHEAYGEKGDELWFSKSSVLYILQKNFGELCYKEDEDSLGIPILKKYGLKQYATTFGRWKVVAALKILEKKIEDLNQKGGEKHGKETN